MLRASPYPFVPMPGWGRAVDGIIIAVLLHVLGDPMIGSLKG